LQLVDYEHVAKASLEEKRIEEKKDRRNEEKEKEATASEKESSSSGSKSSFLDGLVERSARGAFVAGASGHTLGDSRRTANVLRIAHSRGSTTPSRL
jgi:hypothetical protein